MRKKILVVEDDAELIELLCFILKTAGFTTRTATNGTDALNKARTLGPDLILLDLMLPELDGLSVCEILRRDPQTAAIRIIMVTAMSSELARLTALSSGADEYMTKPFSPRQLVGRVQELLQTGVIAN